MQRNNGARLFPMLITLVLVIVAVVAVVAIGRAIFFGGSSETSEQTEQPQDVGRDALLNTNSGRSTRVIVRGPIVADESFTSYVISISPESRIMTVYSGYLDNVRNRKPYDNNTQAYEQFVYALDKANMMKGQVSEDEADEDLRGICADGYVYEYAVMLNSETVKRLWTSTCSGSKGTLEASTEQLNNLFQKQIPAYSDLTPFRQSRIPSLF